MNETQETDQERLTRLRRQWQHPKPGSAEQHDPQGTLREIRRLERQVRQAGATIATQAR